MIEGSISPERVPIIIPARGVNPIEVSTGFPWAIAEIEAPLPRCKVIRFKAANGRCNSSAVLLAT